MRDFSEIWVCDLGGDWKQKGDGGGSNVFGISTGVAICFLVKKNSAQASHVHYGIQSRALSAEDKLSVLQGATLPTMANSLIKPDTKGNWSEVGPKDFATLMPVISEITKGAAKPHDVNAIFKTYTNGINTARDGWVYGLSERDVKSKIAFFLKIYKQHKTGQTYDTQIKWSRNLKSKQVASKKDLPLGRAYVNVNYRPFQLKTLYNSSLLVDEPGLAPLLYPNSEPNPSITVSDTSSRAAWTSFASALPIDFHFGSTSDGYKAIPRYSYTRSGERLDNITDFALKVFTERYGKAAKITKDLIFNYTYAVLQDPIYRAKYASTLRVEHPRIPFYPNFKEWATWGGQLIKMHIDFQSLDPWPVIRVEAPKSRAKGTYPKPILKSLPEQGIVVVDEDTQITKIERSAWNFRIGNRSAIDWVLDQHKEKTLRDLTIRERFNNYRFRDYKESMIALLAKVARLCVETNSITERMKGQDRVGWR